jgi:hypothetical protein
MSLRTLLNASDRGSILERVALVRRDATARWGAMDASQMMRHLAEALGASLGDVHHQPYNRPLFHTRIVKYVFIRVLPFPRNAPTAPELRIVEAAELDVERARVTELLVRYGEQPSDADPHVEHPLFGPMSHAEWAELEYKHVDHHLRQFGM